MPVFKIIALAFFTVFSLTSCATGSVIVTGTVRPAIEPSEVRILMSAPSAFETIGIVEAVGEGFSRQAVQDRVMDELRRRAARVGANGVLLTETGDGVTGALTGRGLAIFIIQD